MIGRGIASILNRRELEENGKARLEARLEQKRLKEKRKSRYKRRLPKSLRRDYAEKMKHLRSI